MKYILIFGIILQMLLLVYKNHDEYEQFYIFKCMLYLFASTVHSVIITITLPLGALIMGAIYLTEKKNRPIKLKLIISGVIIVILSSMSYKDISIPLQKLYLYNINSDAQTIEVYTNSSSSKKYLFNITNKEDISRWTEILKKSKAYSLWDYKVIPENNGYLLEFHFPTKTVPIIVTPSASNLPNVFIGEKLISYTNTMLPDLVNSVFNIKPVSLLIKTNNVEIKDSSIMSDLWQEILWPREMNNSSKKTNVELNSVLLLSQNQKLNITFSRDFRYMKIDDHKVLQLSEYLSNRISEQYILSQLEEVEKHNEYSPAHIHTPPRHTVSYSIELDDTRKYYGLYASDEIKNTKVLLHNVSSAESEYFILKSPYILLLDEKLPSQYYLMLVNQNIPNKHRYIEKGKNISSNSIALCPNNIKFTYTITGEESNTLYLVNNYYDTPTVIATGNILDSLFLSEKYIVFTLTLDDTNLLCIYDTTLSKTVKYIRVSGSIHMIKVENNTIYFSIQIQEKNRLKEGIFILDSELKIKKLKTR